MGRKQREKVSEKKILIQCQKASMFTFKFNMCLAKVTVSRLILNKATIYNAQGKKRILSLIIVH